MTTTRRDLLAGAAALTATAALPMRARAVEPERDPLLARITDELLADYPENALQLGIDKGERGALRPRLTDRSAAAEQARAARAVTRLAQLKAAPRAGDDALDLDVTQAAVALAVEGWRAMPVGDVAVLNSNTSYRNTPYLVSQQSGSYVDIPDLLETKHDVADAADADAYLARLNAFAGQLDDDTARVRTDAAKGAVPPGFLIDITTKQLAGMAAQPTADWGLVKSFGEKCAKAGLAGGYAGAAGAIVDQAIKPALARQQAVFTALHGQASDTPGVWARPGGEGWYRWLLKAATTTERSPDELHQAGLDQCKSLSAELDTLLRAQGLTQGSVGARLTALGKRPDLLFPDTDAGRAELLTYLNGRITDIRARLPRAFDTLVPARLTIKRVPPAIQDGAPNAYAGPGSIDGSQPGIYYINLKTTTIWPRFALPTLCYHEGLPGHVWQGEFSYRLPLIRSLLAFNAYSEGWALYSEQLAGELGVYDGDPLGRIGFLQSMLFRATRLVVDTGLHAKRWSFAQAQSFFEETTGMPRAQIVSELQRYCAVPGQACGYKVGHNEINRLRSKAQAALGSRFDLKALDDAVVRPGNVPLTLLAQVIDAYVAGARG